MSLQILAVDPGPTHSAFCLIDDSDLSISTCAKVINSDLIFGLGGYFIGIDDVVIEECICRKWAGREVSDTAFESGRMYQASLPKYTPTLMSRSAVRGHWRASNDSKIINRMISRFEPDLFNKFLNKQLTRPKMIIESKKGWFKDFKSDIWQAYALGVAFIDKKQGV